MSKTKDDDGPPPLLPSITSTTSLTIRTAPPSAKPFSKLRTTISNKLTKRFPKFMDLPAEIRLLIWEDAMPDGRVHELHPCVKLLDNGKMMFRSNHSSPPILLSVCRESRQITLQYYKLMVYDSRSALSKGIRRFYFNPERDTLFLNTLMGLYMAFMLLEEEPVNRVGVMTGWRNIAFDADRAHLITLLAGREGHASEPRFREVFPDLKVLTLAVDVTKKGRTRFRTSVWPGENGTSLKVVDSKKTELVSVLEPMAQSLISGFPGLDLECVELARVRRKRYIRGDMRYGLRKSCAVLGIRPGGFLMRL